MLPVIQPGTRAAAAPIFEKVGVVGLGLIGRVDRAGGPTDLADRLSHRRG